MKGPLTTTHYQSPIHINLSEDNQKSYASHPTNALLPPDVRSAFDHDGFVVFHHVVAETSVAALNERLEEVLRGRYDRHVPPDKSPRLIRGEWKVQNGDKNENAQLDEHDEEEKATTAKTTTTVETTRRTKVGRGQSAEFSSSSTDDDNEVQINYGDNSMGRPASVYDDAESAAEQPPGTDNTDAGQSQVEEKKVQDDGGCTGRRTCGPKTQKKKTKKQITLLGPLGFSGNLQNVRVLQIINVHKCDGLFRRLVTNEALGKIVAGLAGWKHGARLAQDQVWAKPPGAPPLVFHRDSPYFMFTPSDVVTVWIALDDMDGEIGPLQYVRGSHYWGDGRVGSSNNFFQKSHGGMNLLRSAAEREGIDMSELEFVSMAGMKAGGMSIHNGRTWHGSGKNESKDRPRRGIGLHFVPAEVQFTMDACKSSLWRKYIKEEGDAEGTELSEEDFPVTWRGDCS